ncbi:MAG: preprotein translocase subunit SecY [Chloroflexi bacterium]|nr:preprotein translocase subunit SecY [Chloroflexota bacterium]MBI5291651.1 preprotein translocase subunit SecY [Chloroflexota bacterium]MBI5828397.1 preprotein translocase subunit SecY [Chloroflexota bacterium]
MKRSAWRYLWSAEEIRNRVLITLGLLILYRLAAHVPVPGVNRDAIQQILTSGGGAGNLLSLLDLLSGGTVSNFSVLAMGVYPYITAQIILQLLVPIIPALQKRMEDDPKAGREFQERWTYYLAIPMAALSAIGQIRIFNASIPGVQVLPQFGFSGANLLPTLTTIISMAAGTMFAIWLGELISEYGIRGQGLSLIIFSGIVSRLPSTVGTLWVDQERRWLLLGAFVLLMALTVFAIVIVTQGRRNVPVMYPGRRVGNRQSMPVKGTLPLLVNMAGMIPIIFAQSILTFPAIIAQFFTSSQLEWVRNLSTGTISLFSDSRNNGYITIYFFMVVLFSFFYTDVIFQQQNYGENLKKVGAQVPGVTKGVPTQRYLNRVLQRITLPGAVFLGVVAILPFVAGNVLQANAFSVLGSGLLIVVGVVKDTFFGLETELKLRGYDDSLLVR